MPVREKAVDCIIDLAFGPTEGMPKVIKRALQYAVEGVYVETMEEVDWKRVMHDAATRHMELHDGEYLTSSLEDEHASGEVCSECIHEAVIANEWGGVKSWSEHPRGLRHRMRLSPLSNQEVGAVVTSIAARFMAPTTAPEGDRDEDGHLPGCEEVGRHPDYRMMCDPACPHYDGWIKELS